MKEPKFKVGDIVIYNKPKEWYNYLGEFFHDLDKVHGKSVIIEGVNRNEFEVVYVVSREGLGCTQHVLEQSLSKA